MAGALSGLTGMSDSHRLARRIRACVPKRMRFVFIRLAEEQDCGLSPKNRCHHRNRECSSLLVGRVEMWTSHARPERHGIKIGSMNSGWRLFAVSAEDLKDPALTLDGAPSTPGELTGASIGSFSHT